MYYGHASWVALVVFGGMLGLRAVAAPRRRRGPRGPGVPGRPFTGADRSVPAVGPPSAPPRGGEGETATGTPPGWFVDPFLRHGHRYWSGSEWSEHISDDGVPGTDPPPPPVGGPRG